MVDASLAKDLQDLAHQLNYPIEELSAHTLLDLIFGELEKPFIGCPINPNHYTLMSDFAKLISKYALAEQAKELLLEMTYRLVTPFFQPVFAKLIQRLEISQSIDLFRYGKPFAQFDFQPDAWGKYQYQSRQKPLMLLVEQNPVSGDYIFDFIQSVFDENLLVLNATDSATVALIYALSFRPDFIITDGWFLYSAINGYAMLDLLKEFPETQAIPFSIVTANDIQTIPPDIIKSAKHILQKPFDIMDYEKAIEFHLKLLANK